MIRVMLRIGVGLLAAPVLLALGAPPIDVAAAAHLPATPAAQSASAFKTGQQHANVELVAERTAAVPGQMLSVGVHFQMDPHWHIYWRNPGDSGGPPAIDWRLPDGFQAGELQWPAPRRIQAATLINYGYEGDVLLPLSVRVPANAKAGSEVELTGHVKYLICSELCVPGRADVKLTVPVAASAGSPSPVAELFTQARTQLPQPAPAGWTARAAFAGANRHFDLSVQTGKREETGNFFPLVPSQIDDSAPQQMTPLDRGIRFGLRASDQLTAAPRTLTGVLVLADGKAYTISAPVTGAPITGGR